MTNENIDLSRMANDAYCRLGAELQYYKERCRLAENIIHAKREFMNIDLAYQEYYDFVNKVNNPVDLRQP